MDISNVKALIELIENSDVTEIFVQDGKKSIRVSRATMAAPVMTATHHVPSAVTVSSAVSSSPSPAQEAASLGHKVLSPMVGTLYMASSPENPPFVALGKSVSKGDTLCIIEAMKMFNEIEADQSGTITAILVNNGDAVEYGQPLFTIS